MKTVLALYGVLVAVAAIILVFHFWRKRRAPTARIADDGIEEGRGIDERLYHKRSLPWLEVMPHLKLDEFLQIAGEAINGNPYLLIFQIDSSHKLNLIYSRYAKTRQTDSFSLGISQSTSLRVYASGAKEIGKEVIQVAGDDPESLLSNATFELVISNATNLRTGNCIHIAAKCSTLEVTFIKAWDVPSRYADEALVAKNAVEMDVAHLAERIQDVQRAAVVGNQDGRHMDELKPGVCYVLGSWGGEEINFLVNRDVAMLMVESFDPSMSLAGFLASLSLKPMMHSRLVRGTSETETLLICPAAHESAHKVVPLTKTNAILSIAQSQGMPVDVLKVAGRGQADGCGVSLSYLPSKQFQNVLIWCLPPRPDSAATEELASAIQCPSVSRKAVSDTDSQLSNFCLAFQNSRIELNEGTNVLGRWPEVNVVLEDPYVSNRHCELRIEGNSVLVRDLDSSNGTYVEGASVGSLFVELRGRLRIGSVECELQRAPSKISIPEIAPAPAPAPVFLEDGSPACMKNAGIRATHQCAKCGLPFHYDNLRKVGLVGSKNILCFCPDCDGQCFPLPDASPTISRHKWLPQAVSKWFLGSQAKLV